TAQRLGSDYGYDLLTCRATAPSLSEPCAGLETLRGTEGAHTARRGGVAENDIATASVFTTLSATALLEKIRDQIHAATPAPADFLLGADGMRTVFSVNQLSSITFNRQTNVSGALSPVPV